MHTSRKASKKWGNMFGSTLCEITNVLWGKSTSTNPRMACCHQHTVSGQINNLSQLFTSRGTWWRLSHTLLISYDWILIWPHGALSGDQHSRGVIMEGRPCCSRGQQVHLMEKLVSRRVFIFLQSRRSFTYHVLSFALVLHKLHPESLKYDSEKLWNIKQAL